jgi:hypothetical protein
MIGLLVAATIPGDEKVTIERIETIRPTPSIQGVAGHTRTSVPKRSVRALTTRCAIEKYR